MTRRENHASHEQALATRDFYRVAIVGAATLKGRELKEILETRNFPSVEVKLLDDEESLGQLDSVGDEATFIQSVLPENLEATDIVFFASDESFTRKNWEPAKRAGKPIIDLSYALENEAGASLCSPWVEHELEHSRAEHPAAQLDSKLVVAAHPAATVLGLVLLRAQKAGELRSAVCNVFEPASERGRRGMDELHGQTVSLLSFQPMTNDIFGAQLAFNLLDRYGEKSTPALDSVERRVLAHLEKITEGRTVVPAFALAQAPIFHGHVFSIYLEFEQAIAADDLARSLGGEHVHVTHTPEDAPTNVGAAGQDQIQLALRRDARHERGLWLWAAADNLRVGALTAVDCASELLRLHPKGNIQ